MVLAFTMIGKPFLLSVVLIVAKFDSLDHLILSVCCLSACFVIISQSHGYFIEFSYWAKNGQPPFVLSLFLSFVQIWGSCSYEKKSVIQAAQKGVAYSEEKLNQKGD